MRTPYDKLTLSPSVVAQTVVEEKFLGYPTTLFQYDAVEVERLRERLTKVQRCAFVDAASMLCRAAYDTRAIWFRRCVQAKDNSGRDMLYNMVRHWLTSFVHDPADFTRNVEWCLRVIEPRGEAGKQ